MISPKALLGRVVPATILVVFTLSLLIVLNHIFKRPTVVGSDSTSQTATATDQPKTKAMLIAQPVRIKIPKIGLDASVEPVGLTTTGDVGVPIGRINAGWYDRGPRPGEVGDAVVDGHFGWWADGTPTVFVNLNKLSKGDRIYVKDAKGVTTVFAVRELKTYSPTQDDRNVFVSRDVKAHLNLITCVGAWDKVKKSYPDRLVVFTDKLTS